MKNVVLSDVTPRDSCMNRSSEECIASNIRVKRISKINVNVPSSLIVTLIMVAIFLRNVGSYKTYTESDPRRLHSLFTVTFMMKYEAAGSLFVLHRAKQQAVESLHKVREIGSHRENLAAGAHGHACRGLLTQQHGFRSPAVSVSGINSETYSRHSYQCRPVISLGGSSTLSA
jgi:hypothetical protein